MQIKFALGYPLIGYRDLYPGVDFTLDQYSLDDAASTIIIALLDSFAALQVQLTAANSEAGIKKVDEIEFQTSKGVSGSVLALRSAGRQIVQQISSAMAIPIGSDIFASGGSGVAGLFL
jgi:hypothetical protein